MGIGFKSDCYLCCALMLFLQLWPSEAIQIAVKNSGYVAGFSKSANADY